jgi:hypothetical protein
MENLYQLRSKNDRLIKQLDFDSRDLIKSIMNYIGQYEISRYELERVKSDVIDKAYAYKKRNTSIYKEIKDVKTYATTLSSSLNLEKISLKNLLMVEYFPIIGFFFVFILLVLHLFGVWFSGVGSITTVDVSLGYPLFMGVQYLSIVYLLYLERRYSIENKTKKLLGSFANIFLVLTVIQFISESPTLSQTLFQVNILVLVGVISLFLVWVIYKELQTK